ncbi:hypothetical protein ACLB2K_074187 [Fragaria x ananassa]
MLQKRQALLHLQVLASGVHPYQSNLDDQQLRERKRCSHYITIHGNGRSVKAKVVDECDSTMGCDPDHDYQPPCPHNIVDASKAVWKALGVKESDSRWGEMPIFWSDA